MSSRHFLVMVGLVAACGSNPREIAHQQARTKADTAHREGRYVDAVNGYRDACRLDPKDTDSCRVGEELAEFVVQQALASAEPVCDRGEARACGEALAPARQVAPDDARMIELLDRAGDRHLAGCAGEHGQEPAERLAELRCATEVASLIATERYEERVRALGHLIGGELAALAQRSDMAAAPGARATLLELAQCADPRSQADAARAASDRFRGAMAVPVRLVTDVRGVDPTSQVGLCDRVAGALGGRIRCADTGLDASVTIETTPIQHTTRDETLSQRYQSGVDRIVNPAFAQAARRARSAERARRQIEIENLERKNACERAEARRREAGYCYDCPEHTDEESLCSAADDFSDLYDRRAREADDAQRELDSTPQILEEPIYADAYYTVRHHHWSMRYTLRVVLGDGTEGALENELSFADSEHGGAPEAGVAPDPLHGPGRGYFGGAIADAITEPVATTVDALLRDRAADRGNACPGAPAFTATWLSCWAEARFLAGDDRAAATLVPGLQCVN